MSPDATPTAGRAQERPRGERVELAWQRSSLAFAAIGVLLLRRTLPNVPVRPGLAVALIVVGGLAVLLGAVYREGFGRRPVRRRTELRFAAAGAIGLGLTALAVSLVA